MYGVMHNGAQIGTVRECVRVSEFHGVVTVLGKVKSRYYGTLQGAARWVLRQNHRV
jgi:hypothetical protein